MPTRVPTLLIWGNRNCGRYGNQYAASQLNWSDQRYVGVWIIMILRLMN
jgi:hypothetical protein